jgi:hypothetical protein
MAYEHRQCCQAAELIGKYHPIPAASGVAAQHFRT